MLKLFAFLALGIVVAGCESQPPRGLDPDRILHMAGEEAGQIAAPRERLTRQLNIANRETQSGKPANGLKTLAVARQTLDQAPKTALSDQERLSGWISICELSREAGDKSFASEALDKAMAALEQLAPAPARCEYVPGIEHEMRLVRGDAAAAALLRSGAEWAMDLPEHTRRSAFFVFAEELFRCNDYDGALKVLRYEKDAAWRSDALTAMSDSAREEVGQSKAHFYNAANIAQGMSEPATTGSGDTESIKGMQSSQFGKSLDFKSNYYRP
jgi:hypothetical protein